MYELIAQVRLDSKTPKDNWYKYTTNAHRFRGTVSSAKGKAIRLRLKWKVHRHDHAVSPGRARPVVVAVLGSLLFHER